MDGYIEQSMSHLFFLLSHVMSVFKNLSWSQKILCSSVSLSLSKIFRLVEEIKMNFTLKAASRSGMCVHALDLLGNFF